MSLLQDVKIAKEALLLLGGVILTVAVGGVAVDALRAWQGAEPPDPNGVHIGGYRFQVEIVDTEPKIQMGLSGRASLEPDEGMLFVFPRVNVYPFWMRDMHFPLDIIWIYQGAVQEVVTLPVPVFGKEVPTHTPHGPADHVLELNAGMAEKAGIRPGVKIRLPR